MPVNDGIYDKSEGKTKNDDFREILIEVLARGLKPAFVTGDFWYSCTTNLGVIKNHQTGFVFAVETNKDSIIGKRSVAASSGSRHSRQWSGSISERL